jgi:hypothetical protein
MRVKLVTITRIDGASESSGDQADELDGALGERGVVAEIDRDVLAKAIDGIRESRQAATAKRSGRRKRPRSGDVGAGKCS